MSAWIKCTDQMPPRGKTVLIWYRNDWEFGMTFGGKIISIYDAGGWQATKVDARQEDIRWQPLPEKPEGL